MSTSQAVKDERAQTMNKAVAELELESTTENSAGHQTALLAGFLGWYRRISQNSPQIRFEVFL